MWTAFGECGPSGSCLGSVVLCCAVSCCVVLCRVVPACCVALSAVERGSCVCAVIYYCMEASARSSQVSDGVTTDHQDGAGNGVCQWPGEQRTV